MSVSFIRATATTAGSKGVSTSHALKNTGPYYNVTNNTWEDLNIPAVSHSTGCRFYAPAYTQVQFNWSDLPQNTSGLFLVPQRCSIKAELTFAAGHAYDVGITPHWNPVPAGGTLHLMPTEAWAVQLTHNWLNPEDNWKLNNTVMGYLGQSPTGSLAGGACFSPTAYKNAPNSAAILGGIIPDITDLEAEGYGQSVDGVSLESFRGARDHAFAAMKLTSYNRNRGEPYFRINNVGDVEISLNSGVTEFAIASMDGNVGTEGIYGQGRIHQRSVASGIAPHFDDMCGYPFTNFSKTNQGVAAWNTGKIWRSFIGDLSYQSWNHSRDYSSDMEGTYCNIPGAQTGNCFPVRANTYASCKNFKDGYLPGSSVPKKSIWNAGPYGSTRANHDALGESFDPYITVVDEDKFKPICPLFEGNLPIDLIPNLRSGLFLLMPTINLSPMVSFYMIGLDMPVAQQVTTNDKNSSQPPYSSVAKTDFNSCPLTLAIMGTQDTVTTPNDSVVTNARRIPRMEIFTFKELKYTVEFCVVNITSKLQAERLFYLNTLGAVEYIQVPLWLKWNVALEDAEYQQFRPGATAYDLGYLTQKTDDTGHIPFTLTYAQISDRIQKAMNYRNSTLTVSNIVPVRCMVTSTIPFDYANFKTMTYSGNPYPNYRVGDRSEYLFMPYNVATANGTYVFNNIGPLGAASKMRDSSLTFTSTDDLGDTVTITAGSGGVMDIERRLMNPDAIIPNEQAFTDANLFNDTAVYMTMDCVDGYHSLPAGGSISFSLGVDSWRNAALYTARVPGTDPSLGSFGKGNCQGATATTNETVLPVPTLIFPKTTQYYSNTHYKKLTMSDFVDFYSRCVEVWLAIRIAIPVISLNPTAAQEVAKAGGRIRTMNDISTDVGHFPIIVR